MPFALAAALLGAGMAWVTGRMLGATPDAAQTAYYFFLLLGLFTALARAWSWRGNAVAGGVLAAGSLLAMLALGSAAGRALLLAALVVALTVAAGALIRRLLGAPA